MLNTFKQFRTNMLLIPAMFLLLNNVSAQPIIFSSDQWPKRWERAMKNVSLNGHVTPVRQREYNRYRSGKEVNGVTKLAQASGWGKPPERKRHKHKRSRTPDYGNGSHHRYDEDPLKKRYAVPNMQPHGYGAYPSNGYYGASIPAYPHMPSAVYPGSIPGIYPYMSAYPGLGVPGFGIPRSPYATPFYSAPGLYPMGVYPGPGYRW